MWWLPWQAVMTTTFFTYTSDGESADHKVCKGHDRSGGDRELLVRSLIQISNVVCPILLTLALQRRNKIVTALD